MIRKTVIGFSIIILLFLTYCKSVDKSVTSTVQLNTEIVEILFPDTLSIGENFRATVTNVSTDTVFIHQPELKHFEKSEEPNWRRIKIIQCPCGANCEPSPELKKLAPGEKHFIDWNVKESWCGKMMENGIPETIEIQAKPGNYRFTVTYSLENAGKEKIRKEFTILEP